MKIKQSLIPFLLVLCLGTSSFAKGIKVKANPPDAKAIITDYINAIGGVDAIRKIRSTRDSGSFSVQGMSLPVLQKRMAPNKTLQVVNMNGTTVAKTVFNGTKGYSEQMGNHMDMGETEMTDMKIQTSVIPQLDYLTSSAFTLSLQGTEKIGDAEAYKILITMPSGTADTEYYDKATKLLVKQVLTKTVSGQTVTIANSFGDYRKTGDVLMPYKQTLNIVSGAINQSVDILLSDIKVNEGVTGADFE